MYWTGICLFEQLGATAEQLIAIVFGTKPWRCICAGHQKWGKDLRINAITPRQRHETINESVTDNFLDVKRLGETIACFILCPHKRKTQSRMAVRQHIIERKRYMTAGEEAGRS